LKPAQESVIRLVKLKGLSIAGASGATGQSTALVKINIHRGLKKLAASVSSRHCPQNELKLAALAKGNSSMLRQIDRLFDLAWAAAAFRHDVLRGLSIQPRSIPARWPYDRRGSALFEAITALRGPSGRSGSLR
jgi:hypothetical protein